MPLNPPKPRTKSDDVQDAIIETRRFLHQHSFLVIYLAVGAIVVGALWLAGYSAIPVYAAGYVAAGLALLADYVVRGR